MAHKTTRKQGGKGRPFKKGQSGNPAGRPKGSLNFATKWFAAIETLAKKDGVQPTEMEEELLMVGYKKARKGDYNFYRDAMNRVYGMPVQKQILANDKENPLIDFGSEAKKRIKKYKKKAKK